MPCLTLMSYKQHFIGYCSPYCDMILDKRNPRGFTLVHSWTQSLLAARTDKRDPRHLLEWQPDCVREMKTDSQLTFSVPPALGPSPWNGATLLQGQFARLVQTALKWPSQSLPKLSFLFHSEFHRIYNEAELARARMAVVEWLPPVFLSA